MALNTRQRMYAKCRAAGMTQLEAYTAAGYDPHEGNACTLDSNLEVRTMVEALQDQALDAAKLTPDIIASMVLDIAQGANVKEADKMRALEFLGKWKAMLIDVKHNRDIPSDAEVIKKLKEVAPDLANAAEATLTNSDVIGRLRAG